MYNLHGVDGSVGMKEAFFCFSYHIYLHNNAINQLSPIQCDVRSVGGRDQVGVRKNTPCLSEYGHVLPKDLQKLTINIKLKSPP